MAVRIPSRMSAKRKPVAKIMTPGRAAFKGVTQIDGHSVFGITPQSASGRLTPQERAREARRAFSLPCCLC